MLNYAKINSELLWTKLHADATKLFWTKPTSAEQFKTSGAKESQAKLGVPNLFLEWSSKDLVQCNIDNLNLVSWLRLA